MCSRSVREHKHVRFFAVGFGLERLRAAMGPWMVRCGAVRVRERPLQDRRMRATRTLHFDFCIRRGHVYLVACRLHCNAIRCKLHEPISNQKRVWYLCERDFNIEINLHSHVAEQRANRSFIISSTTGFKYIVLLSCTLLAGV